MPDGIAGREARSWRRVAVADEIAAVEAALDAPIRRQRWSKWRAARSTAAISVCDITRPAPNRITLPPLLARLHQAGIPRHHDPDRHRVASRRHDGRSGDHSGAGDCGEVSRRKPQCAAREQHRSIGATRRGTPVYVDERFMSADLHITLGFVEQHLMLGFCGGRKLIAPGQAAQETIKVIHSPKFIREPLATEGSIEGNPLHDELLECRDGAARLHAGRGADAGTQDLWRVRR